MTTFEPKWQRVESKRVFDGRVKIDEHSVILSTGESTSYEVEASLQFAVAVLIVTDDDQVVVTRQYRFPLDAWIYDLPGGGGNLGETPREAALRECREEVGMEPTNLVHLQTFYPNPGRSSWPAHVFFCRSVVSSSSDTSDPSEVVETVQLPLSELDSLILNGSVVDPSLLIARAAASWHGYLPHIQPA